MHGRHLAARSRASPEAWRCVSRSLIRGVWPTVELTTVACRRAVERAYRRRSVAVKSFDDGSVLTIRRRLALV